MPRLLVCSTTSNGVAQIVEPRGERLVGQQASRQSASVLEVSADLLDVGERRIELGQGVFSELRILDQLAENALPFLERLEDLLERDRDRVQVVRDVFALLEQAAPLLRGQKVALRDRGKVRIARRELDVLLPRQVLEELLRRLRALAHAGGVDPLDADRHLDAQGTGIGRQLEVRYGSDLHAPHFHRRADDEAVGRGEDDPVGRLSRKQPRLAADGHDADGKNDERQRQEGTDGRFAARSSRHTRPLRENFSATESCRRAPRPSCRGTGCALRTKRRCDRRR